MSQNIQYRTVKIKFTDVTPSLDAAYGLKYTIIVVTKCMGNWVQEHSSGLLEQYSDWPGGIDYANSFGCDPHKKWKVYVTPIGSDEAHLVSGANAEVTASSIAKHYDWTVNDVEINIPWTVQAAA